MNRNISMLAFKGTMLEGELTDGELLEHVCSFLCDNSQGIARSILPKIESNPDRATFSAALRLARNLDQTWAREGTADLLHLKAASRHVTALTQRGHGERVWWSVLPGVARKIAWNESRVFHFIATTVYQYMDLFRQYSETLSNDPMGILEAYEMLVIIEAFCHCERFETEHALSKKGTKLQKRLWELTAAIYDETKDWPVNEEEVAS